MSLVTRVERAFAADGALARHWPAWEARAGQRELAIEVARTFQHGGVLLAEAPTGVGKSLAYLLPAVLHASATGERVVVATCTRSLQDQLFDRDLPAVLAALGVSLPVALLKGKQNYACPRALELAGAPGGAGAGEGAPGEAASGHEVLEALRGWAAADDTGDLDRFAHEDGEAARTWRARVATDPAACTAATCRRGRECFWVRARRRAAEASVVVVNHALLARAAEADGLLPPYDVLVVDEAHRLEGVLSAQLERSASRNRIEELLRLTGPFALGRRGSGILPRLRGFVMPLLDPSSGFEQLFADLEQLTQRAEDLRRDADTLFALLGAGMPPGEGPYARRVRHRAAGELLGHDLQALEVVLEHMRRHAVVLGRAASLVQSASAPSDGAGGGSGSWSGAAAEELQGEVENIANRWQRLGDDLAALVDADEKDWAYWRSLGPRSRAAELHAAPVWVGEHARRLVKDGTRAAVLTSATLSAAGDFAWTAERLGLGEERSAPYACLSVPSPFPLARQMRAYVLDGAADESTAIADVVAALWHAARRNTLVLFTAHERLRRAHDRLRALLPPDAPLLAQDRDGPAGLLADRFRAEQGAVLLGVQSLWEGVDFPGEALEVLVVARLPFSVPDDPVVEARAERLRDRDLEPFRHDAVPEAVMRFRQGVGRLIRRSTDRGVLVVCDPRLARASYRGPFRAALPVEPQLWKDPRGLAAEAGAFLASEESVSMEESS